MNFFLVFQSKTAITLEEAERRHDEILGINVPATALPSGVRMKNEAGVRSYAMVRQLLGRLIYGCFICRQRRKT